MRKSLRFVYIIVFILLLSTSKADNTDVNELEIYILRHIEGGSEFIKDELPICIGDDIQSYEWSTHTIAFKEEYISVRERYFEDDSWMGASKVLGVFYPNQFALYLKGEELYRGYLEPSVFISFMPRGAIISDAENGIVINCNDANNDPRNNRKLNKFLKNHHLLK